MGNGSNHTIKCVGVILRYSIEPSIHVCHTIAVAKSNQSDNN